MFSEEICGIPTYVWARVALVFIVAVFSLGFILGRASALL